jgi:hypothetical protein
MEDPDTIIRFHRPSHVDPYRRFPLYFILLAGLFVKPSTLIGSQKVLVGLFVTHQCPEESEKCHFRFPHKSMTKYCRSLIWAPYRGAVMTFCEAINYEHFS